MFNRVLPLLTTSYTIVEINDEKFSGMQALQNSYFPYVIMVMFGLIAIWILAEYIWICNIKRNRIKELIEDEDIKLGWNIRTLNDTLFELELIRANELVDMMEEDLVKKLKGIA